MDRILLSHGGGGRHTRDLVRNLFARHFSNPVLTSFGDSAILDFAADVRTSYSVPRTSYRSLAFTTDSYVVRPLTFPGGDIGKLAVCGTVNDLAVSGAVPRWISSSFIIEEGLELKLLERIVASMAAAARDAGVQIVCGDTKVVERGAGFGLFINTSGIGEMITAKPLSPETMRPGDKILINGFIADHGIAVMAARKDIKLESAIVSDCAALGELTQRILAAAPGTRCMRDATRGGLAAVLNEWIEGATHGIMINEGAIPLRDSTRAVCEMLGFDPLAIANEGKLVAAVPAAEADAALAAMRAHPFGSDASVIGEITADRPGKVVLHTAFGTTRIVPLPSGELLPRIC